MSASPRGLIIAIEQYDPKGSIPNQLDGTKEMAQAFREWLETKKGVLPKDIVECVSKTFPAPETTKKEILKKLNAIQLEWQDRVSELYVFMSGHGLSQKQTEWPADYLITSDFEKFEYSGDAAIAIQEMQRKLLRSLGPGEHYYFVDVCRTEAPKKQIVLGPLTLTENRSAIGDASYFTLFSARSGAAAHVKSGFGAALVDGLHGEGHAKEWVQNQLYVTFNKLRKYVQKRIEPQEVDPDSKGMGTGLILVVTPVDSPCEIEVLGATDDDEFDFSVSDVRNHHLKAAKFQGSKHRLDLPPDEYLIEVKWGEQALERVEPPEGALDLYDPCVAKFRKQSAAHAATAPATLDLQFPHVTNVRITEEGSGSTYTVEGSEAVQLSPGSYSVEMLDRGAVIERVHRNLGGGEHVALELGAPKRTRAHNAIRRAVKKAGGQDLDDARVLDFSESMDGPIANQDLTLWLALLGASRVIRDPGEYRKLIQLAAFDDIAPHASPTYVLAGFEGKRSSVIVRAGEQGATLAAVKTLTNVQHARLDTPNGPALLEFTLPEAKTAISIATHALPNRVTLVVLVHSDDGRWLVRQLILPLWTHRKLMPGRVRDSIIDLWSLKTVHASVQAQTLFTREHSIKLALRGTDDYWSTLLYGKWLDPVMSLIACYELIRRGNVKDANLPQVLKNLRRYFPGLADTEAIARMAGKKWMATTATPMFLDGALAMPETLEERRGMQVLDYRAPWTMWIGPLRTP